MTAEAKQNTINNIVEPCLVLKAQKDEIINRDSPIGTVDGRLEQVSLPD
jgi:hypothetical protein